MQLQARAEQAISKMRAARMAKKPDPVWLEGFRLDMTHAQQRATAQLLERMLATGSWTVLRGNIQHYNTLVLYALAENDERVHTLVYAWIPEIKDWRSVLI